MVNKPLIILLLFFLFSVADAKTPVGFMKWRLGNDTTFSKQIGGAVRNYKTPSKTWAAIENDFEVEGDSVVFVDKAVLRTRVSSADGVSKVMLTWDGVEYTIEQRMAGIGWYKPPTEQSQWIDSTMDWSGFSVDSNVCKWTGVSRGIDYRARKSDGQVEHGLFLEPAFLDSAVTLYNQRPDSLDIALANVMVYTLSANIDGADSAMGDVPWRRLKDFGYYSFDLTEQRLHFPGSDTLPPIPVRQCWERRGTKIVCIEYVMMRRVKQVHETYPGATIWHNDTKKIEGTANVEDAFLNSALPEYSYGGATELKVSSAGYPTLVRVRNVDLELPAGATISGVVCSLYCYTNITNGDIGIWSIFKPWVEGDDNEENNDDGDVTWNDFQSDALEWGTEGCLCAKDDGVDNSQDNGACNNPRADRTATEMDTETVDGVGWFGWDITPSLGQGWYDGTKNEEGIYFWSSPGLNFFRSTEAGSNQPFWVFTYTVAAAEVPTGRRRKIIMEYN